MRLLIVHDRRELAADIEKVARASMPNGLAVDTAFDVFSARDLLMQNFYDLAVIDLTLPIRGNAPASLQNAEFLLEEIFGGGEAKTPGDVLGISVDPSVIELVKTSVGRHLMACLHEAPCGTWRSALGDKLTYVASAGRARRLVANSSYDFDLAIVTALDKEARPYRELFEPIDSDDLRGAKEFSFQSVDGQTRRGVLFAIGQSGQAPAASATQAILTQFRPKLALMTGFCGGVKERTSLGDLIGFRSSSAWDYGKWEQEETDGRKLSVFRARPTALNVPEKGIVEVMRAIEDEGGFADEGTLGCVVESSKGKITGWKTRSKAAGSGSAVVTDLEKVDQIQALDENIWAIDMESYAFYFACRNTPVPAPDFMCVKAVADHCNGDKTSDLHEACSYLSASLAYHVATRRYDFTQR